MGNNRETSNYTTAVAKQRSGNHHSNVHERNNYTARERRYLIRGPCRDAISRASQSVSGLESVSSSVNSGQLLESFRSWAREHFEDVQEGERPPMKATSEDVTVGNSGFDSVLRSRVASCLLQCPATQTPPVVSQRQYNALGAGTISGL
jgi:hypothetical protein